MATHIINVCRLAGKSLLVFRLLLSTDYLYRAFICVLTRMCRESAFSRLLLLKGRLKSRKPAQKQGLRIR